MISIFFNSFNKDAHENFQQWRDNHPKGYFLNVKTKNSGMIHQSSCTHPGDTDNDDVSLTKRMKCAADSKAELMEYGKYNQMTITLCSDCMK